MQIGRSLVEIASELERQAETMRDFVAPMSKIHFEAMAPEAEGRADVAIVGLPLPEPVSMSGWTHSQLGTFLKIPKPYYDRMRDSAPELLAQSLNRWKADEVSSKRMIRTLDGKARAFVSDSYRSLGNLDLAMAALPVLKEKGAIVRSSEVTETRLYLKAVLPSLDRQVTKSTVVGDVLRGGVSMRNSEVGNGALDIAVFVERLRCTNGMIGESLLRKTHLGSRIGVGLEDAVEMFSSKTRRLDDAAFFSKVRDVLLATLVPDFIDAIVVKADRAAGDRIPKDANLEAVVEVTAQRYSLPEGHKNAILHNLISGGDLSRWGLANAVTATANDVTDYESATALESIGGKIIDLSSDDWRTISDLPRAA